MWLSRLARNKNLSGQMLPAKLELLQAVAVLSGDLIPCLSALSFSVGSRIFYTGFAKLTQQYLIQGAEYRERFIRSLSS